MRKTPTYFVQNFLTKIWFKKSEEVRVEVKDIIENTKDLFNPENTGFIDIDWLKEILEWKIEKSWKIKTFFIICINWISWIPNTFEWNTSDLCYKSEWFWLFSCKGKSEIIFPNSWTFSFDTKSKIYLQDDYKWFIWEWWWFFQHDKNLWNKIIKTNVWAEELQKLLDNYKNLPFNF